MARVWEGKEALHAGVFFIFFNFRWWLNDGNGPGFFLLYLLAVRS